LQDSVHLDLSSSLATRPNTILFLLLKGTFVWQVS